MSSSSHPSPSAVTSLPHYHHHQPLLSTAANPIVLTPLPITDIYLLAPSLHTSSPALHHVSLLFLTLHIRYSKNSQLHLHFTSSPFFFPSIAHTLLILLFLTTISKTFPRNPFTLYYSTKPELLQTPSNRLSAILPPA